VTAYEAAVWSDLFVACAGAAAALAGLLFVAISINVERILQYPELPGRALEAVVLLVGVLVVSVFGLAPGQGRTAVGIEVLSVGVLVTGIVAATISRHPGERRRVVARIIAVAPGTVLLIVGGVSLLAGSGGGLYWVLAAIVGAFVGAIANAWVLLIEILR
jgi:modulator of FtsH protease